MKCLRRISLPTFLIVATLAFISCNPIPPKGILAGADTRAEWEATMEIYYQAVAEINNLQIQIDSDTDTFMALSSRGQAQAESQDIAGLEETVRELQQISLHSADLSQQQSDVVTKALESCLYEELIELLENHLASSASWQDVFELQAELHGLVLRAFKASPGEDLSESEDLWAEMGTETERLNAEAMAVETHRMAREKEILAGKIQPSNCRVQE